MNRMYQILMDEENGGDGSGGGGGNGEGQQQQAGGEGGAGAGANGGQQQVGGGAGGNSQYVPYSRFQEVNTKYKDLETKYGQMNSMLEQMRGALSPEQKKGFKLDYANPDGSIEKYVQSMLEEKINGLKQEGTQREQAQARTGAIKWFREQEDYSPELEEKAAQFIKENGLQGLDPEKGIKLAHKFVTMGDGSGYTRKVKEGLSKPGGGARAKDTNLKQELNNLDPNDEKFEEKMKAIQTKMMGG